MPPLRRRRSDAGVGLPLPSRISDDKEVQAGDEGVFTVAHFDGFLAVLIQLDVVEPWSWAT